MCGVCVCACVSVCLCVSGYVCVEVGVCLWVSVCVCLCIMFFRGSVYNTVLYLFSSRLPNVSKRPRKERS